MPALAARSRMLGHFILCYATVILCQAMLSDARMYCITLFARYIVFYMHVLYTIYHIVCVKSSGSINQSSLNAPWQFSGTEGKVDRTTPSGAMPTKVSHKSLMP